ncbi:response regulator [Mangrovibacterium lignilyticum]|uniref:response regulator n=1 Tax=Mangrovibacterium lignilyticum TaxID=2668052 RepID=UPI0013D292E0|nr:response regulator [Mangrovibacterium lignilyticum]
MVRHSDFKTVVFIDDDREMVNVYNSILERKDLAGYLIHCKDGQEGIKYLRKLKKKDLPDYILLDLYMPEMDGFEFLKEFEKLKSVKETMEVYVCTSSKSKEDRDKVMKYHFVNAYLEKPLSSEFLELLIKDDLNLQN